MPEPQQNQHYSHKNHRPDLRCRKIGSVKLNVSSE